MIGESRLQRIEKGADKAVAPWQRAVSVLFCIRCRVAAPKLNYEHLGQRADEISATHDLSLADVYAALAYYFDHRAEIDATIGDDEAFVAALRAQQPSPLRAKLQSLPA